MTILSQSAAEAALTGAINRVALPGLRGISFEDGFLWGQYLAAEADASRQLRVLFAPTVVFAGDPSPEEIAALDGAPFLVEAAYDYEPDMFRDDKWGMILTRQRPIVSVERVEMVFPAIASAPFRVPADWIRLDRKYGQIRIVPAGAAMATPIAMHLMQIVGGGRSVPHMVRVRYTAGLTDVATNYPDLIDVIKKMAVLRIIDGQFFPQSGSISGDGLSRSVSVDVQKLHDGIDDKLDLLREAIHGVRMVVL